MTLAISSDLNSARLAGVVSFLDQGAATATLQIYGSARPAAGGEPGAAPLVEIKLSKPSGSITDGVLILASSDEPLAYTSGQAVWGRMINGAGAWAFDGDVSDSLGMGDFKMPNTQLYAGGSTRLTSGRLR